MSISFPFRAKKAVEAVCWLVNEHPGIDLYTVVKALYFADKEHLQQYGRPVVGDRYYAMDHGMVPSYTYDALRGERKYHDERDDIIDAMQDAIQETREKFPTYHPRREPNLDQLSGSDIRALRNGLERCAGLEFDELKDLAHGERAYNEAWNNRSPGKKSARMDYELVIDEHLEKRELLLAQLRENAPYMVL